MIRKLLAFIFLPTLAWAACPSSGVANRYVVTVCADSPAAYFNLAQAPTDGATMTDIGSATNCNNSTYTNPGGTHLTGVAGITGVGAGSAAVKTDANAGAYATAVPTSNANCEGAFTSASGVTVETWVKLDTTASGFMVGYGANGNNWQYAIGVNGTGLPNFDTFRWTCDALSSKRLDGTSTITTGKWYMVDGIFNGTTSEDIWVNGVQEATFSAFGFTPCTTSASTGIFFQWPDLTFPLHGSMDETAAFRGSLTGTRIMAHYLAGIARPLTGWPYIVKAPELPQFRNDGYFNRFVERGYNTGLFASTAFEPQHLFIGYPSFSVIPAGNEGK